ncbi:SWIM zinc finger family protein, partial [Flavihumibacter sediminis]|nr:SWIM zinc finger family protein [Flavihumibacter sediminis]
IGKQLQEEDQFTTDRSWLYGLQSGKYALVLQFIVRGQGLQFSLSTGVLLQAELVYFPSAAPLRALIKSQQPIKERPPIKGFSGWQEQLQHRANSFARLPFQ